MFLLFFLFTDPSAIPRGFNIIPCWRLRWLQGILNEGVLHATSKNDVVKNPLITDMWRTDNVGVPTFVLDPDFVAHFVCRCKAPPGLHELVKLRSKNCHLVLLEDRMNDLVLKLWWVTAACQ